jgi:hypothetical protein
MTIVVAAQQLAIGDHYGAMAMMFVMINHERIVNV